MPGHKGAALHGLESLDLTEIKGADSLFEADGIIAHGEQLTSCAYGSRASFWSAEGSSLSIKTSLCIVRQLLGRPIRAASPRSCHRAFISACALLDIEPVWLWSGGRDGLCTCPVTAEQVRECLENDRIDAVYITSPDYFGNIADVKGIAEVCHSHGALLICDNAHGAYLKFTGMDFGVSHPLDLGADIVCDSAHKTLPVYTGGGFLHISRTAPKGLETLVKPAMALFGSTSPSYLIMGSLDKCADLLNGELPALIRACCERTARVKAVMRSRGIPDLSAEPLKITAAAARIGYDGRELADIMRGRLMECEYSDPDAVVLMFSPFNTEHDFERLESFYAGLELRKPLISDESAALSECPERVMSVREAVLSAAKCIPVDDAEGLVSARGVMSCQPSVAAVMPGERISGGMVGLLKKYGITRTEVIK